MHESGHVRAPYIYLWIVTIISVILIIYNSISGMHIPFTASFLVGYVGASLIYIIWQSVITKQWKRTGLMLGLSFLVAFIAEALGVNFGLVFGHYYYTSILGPQLFGVPLLAALAWEPIIYASFNITGILFPQKHIGSISWFKKIPYFVCLSAIGALATTAWDMMIDPIAVNQGWWVWQDGGAYAPYIKNGVPIQNYIGWLLVAFIINLIYRFIPTSSTNQPQSVSGSINGPLLLYCSLFLTSFGVAITILQRTEIALIGLMAMGPFIMICLAYIKMVRGGLA